MAYDNFAIVVPERNLVYLPILIVGESHSVYEKLPQIVLKLYLHFGTTVFENISQDIDFLPFIWKFSNFSLLFHTAFSLLSSAFFQLTTMKVCESGHL